MSTCKQRALFSCLIVHDYETHLLNLHLNATAAHVSAWIVAEAAGRQAELPLKPHVGLLQSLRAEYGPRLIHVIDRELQCLQGVTSPTCSSADAHGFGSDDQGLEIQRNLCARHIHRAPVQPQADDLLLVTHIDDALPPAQLRTLRQRFNQAEAGADIRPSNISCSSKQAACDVIRVSSRSVAAIDFHQ